MQPLEHGEYDWRQKIDKSGVADSVCRSGSNIGTLAKELLIARPKTPENFFSLPNFSQQLVEDVIEGHSRHWRDTKFFYVEPHLR